MLDEPAWAARLFKSYLRALNGELRVNVAAVSRSAPDLGLYRRER